LHKETERSEGDSVAWGRQEPRRGWGIGI